MMEEFGECYPLHLGVTEAGDGEDGRIKSAIGIGTLLKDGIGDTIRVSLTEDPEFEIPVCKDIIKNLPNLPIDRETKKDSESLSTSYSPFEYKRRDTIEISNIGKKHVPVVIADFMLAESISHTDLQAIGYTYNETTDKWNIGDAAADYIYTSNKIIDFALPGTLKVLCDHTTWLSVADKEKYFPLYQGDEFTIAEKKSTLINFVALDTAKDHSSLIEKIKADKTVVLCLYSSAGNAMQSVRTFINGLMLIGIKTPIVLTVESSHTSIDEQLIHFAAESGALFLDGMGDGIWLINDPSKLVIQKVTGRTYLETKNNHQFINNTSFSILQAVRTRISKTEYISCPSCGRTLFDLQETTAKIRAVTNHLKGLKIAIMGCIVNGPGEMADADFGYVGSGVGKITLYKGKEIVKRNIDSAIAVDELINLLKENEAWVETP